MLTATAQRTHHAAQLLMDVTDAKRAVLQEFEEEYAELGRMIARLRRDLGLTEMSAPSSSAGEIGSAAPNGAPVAITELVTPGSLFGVSQVEAVRTFLALNRKPASLRDIAQALFRGGATENLIDGTGALRNLSSILSRAKHVVVSVKHGYWGLVEWYPDRAVRRARRSREDQNAGTTESEGDGGS
jgi:hypothetical protein